MRQGLVSFVLFAWQQERYIREAVQGAFAQRYSPLEIILSDDGSSDSTFAIMEELSREYRGPHRVILNRNNVNLGIGRHVNRLMELSRGELIVIAAGDDVSLPRRVERTWAAYEASGRQARSLYTNIAVIDDAGRESQTVRLALRREGRTVESRLRNIRVCGCSHAWHRDTFRVFGPLLEDTVYEDKAIAFRAALLGEIVHLDETLVRYRRHGANITAVRAAVSPRAVQEHLAERLRRRLATLRNYERDLRCGSEMIRMPAAQREGYLRWVERQIPFLEIEVAFARAGLTERAKLIGRGVAAGAGPGKVARWCVQSAYPYHLHRTRRQLERNG